MFTNGKLRGVRFLWWQPVFISVMFGRCTMLCDLKGGGRQTKLSSFPHDVQFPLSSRTRTLVTVVSIDLIGRIAPPVCGKESNPHALISTRLEYETCSHQLGCTPRSRKNVHDNVQTILGCAFSTTCSATVSMSGFYVFVGHEATL